ncbi:MAG: LysR family transcriptional regulator [Rhodobacteraceae bacterium]|nr:LysR family transcriptional regulator [Paracoccaceae bacterium]
MNSSDALDWSLIRSVLAVAEAGSLSAAARVLGLSQPTLGRQVQAAEEALGVALFRRHARGLALTEAGAAMVAPAREMQAAAARLSLIAAGRETQLSGTVRISASMVVAHHILPPILARLRADEPEIEIELHASDATDNLLWRETDIAVRMYRPEQPDLIARHLGESRLGVFGALSYLERNGTPGTVADLADHDWVGLDRSDLLMRGFAALGWQVDKHFFKVRCDDQAANWALVRAGAGLGITQLAVARAVRGMVQVVPALPLPTLPIWLTAAQALRHTPRLRRVWDALAEGLAPVVAA